MSVHSITRLAWLVHLTYFFVCTFYPENPEKISQTIQERLLNFKPIETVYFKYYRVADLIRLLICEQMQKPYNALMGTQIA